MHLSQVGAVISGPLTGLEKSYVCENDLASMIYTKRNRVERNYSRVELFLFAGGEHVWAS